jgi:PAS domain S-box-containing protein
VANDGFERLRTDNALIRVLDGATAMFAYWDPEQRCRFANRAYERWFRVSPEWLVGKHMRELLGPLYELNLPYIERVLRGEAQEFEREIPDPAGGPPRHGLANYIPDVVDGVVRGFLALVTDISGPKRAELAFKESEAEARRIAHERGGLLAREQQTRDLLEATNEQLRESEERFRTALDEAPIGMALVGLDGHFLRVNRALCEIVGYAPEELRGLTFQVITHPDDLDADLTLAGQLERGEIQRYQLGKRYIRKDGKAVDVMLTGSVVRDRDGAPRYFVAQVEDVTERKQMEDALRASEEGLRSVFALAPEGIFVTGSDGRYLDVNRVACQMLGYSREELLGLSIGDLVPPGEVERLASIMRHILEGGVETSEWLLRRKDGSYVPIELSAGALPDGRVVGFTRDITKRLAAEADLKRSEREFRSLAESMPQIVWATGADGLNIYFNQQWVDYTGLTFEESYGEGWITPFHPDDRQRAWDAWQRATQHRDSYSLECRLRRADGVYTWWLIRGVPQIGANGEILKWFGTCTDIEEIKVAEQRIKESEARFSGIVSISADAIISIDEGQRITVFNEGAEKMFGHSKEEAIGAPLGMLLPERFRGGHRKHVEGFAAETVSARRMGERRPSIFGLRKNGQEFPAEAAVSKIRVGSAWIFTVILRDVTEHKRIEREQRFLAELGSVVASTLDYEETVENLATLAASELGDVCLVDVVEESAMRRLKVSHRDPSKAAVALALQQIQLDLRRPHLGSSVLDTKQSLLMSEVTHEYLESIVQSDEHRRALRELNPKSLMALPLQAHGRLVGVMVLVSTTEAHRYSQGDLPLAEEVARRAALGIENARLFRSAQRAIQARDGVLGIVAHDLRNPLCSISLQAALLRRPGTEPERRSRKPAEAIERAATRMNRLIQDLLDVTRMDAGQQSIERKRVPAAQVVVDVLESQTLLASTASLDLQIEVPPKLPDVWADRDRVMQVFENLVGNALKFTAPGGRITIGAKPRDGEVLFWVADTGTGVPAHEVEHLFERFWRARKADRKGAGLGLAIVKGIVEAHGGRIWVETKIGAGTTFLFTVPTAPSEGEQAPVGGIHPTNEREAEETSPRR